MNKLLIKPYSMPLVSVIINCYNGEEFLNDCIDSVIAQSYPNWEIIFIDNNSDDTSSKIINSYDINLKYYKLENTISLYNARNFAIEKAKGDFIAFLDCDDIWALDKLETQVEKLIIGYDLVFSSYEIIDLLGTRTGESVLVGENKNITANLLLKRNLISISSVILKSDLVKYNKFNPKFNLIGDFDLWVRLSLKHKFYSINKILQFNREHANNLSKTMFSDWILERRSFVISNLMNLLLSGNFYILFYAFKAEINNIYYVGKKLFKK